MSQPPSACRRRSRARVASLLASLASLVAMPAHAAASPINAVGIENEYADMIQQVGGGLVVATAIETDPNTDPHSFEVSPAVAKVLAGASLVVENGLGYDSWADRILRAAPAPGRQVIVVQHLLGVPDTTANPHLWYDPRTMPAVAASVADALARLDPADAAVFHRNAEHFTASLAAWRDAIAAFARAHRGVAVAVTEPVADDMLEAAGCLIMTPATLQAAIMNGTDPSPQDVTRQNQLLAGRHVAALVYNQQVTDSLTQSFLHLAQSRGIPVVGVYETMPTPGYDYQDWMVAEVAALGRAIGSGRSTQTLARH